MHTPSHRWTAAALIAAAAGLSPALVNAQSVSLQQCANGSEASPRACGGGAWINGKLSRKNAHYYEGDSVPFRALFDNLVVGQPYTLTLQYDTTEGGLHGYDYLTHYTRTEFVGNEPCADVGGCGAPSSFFIPLDPSFTNGTSTDITQVPGWFTLFSGTILGVSSYTFEGSYEGRSSNSLTVTFIANSANPVLTWGAHLASQQDWGPGAASSDIPGASFHVRVYEFAGKNAGNQDRAISDVGVR